MPVFIAALCLALATAVAPPAAQGGRAETPVKTQPAAKPVLKSKPFEIVVVDHDLVQNGANAETDLKAFARRIETVMGLAADTVKVTGFVDSGAAEAYIKTAKPAFAILELHAYVKLQGRAKPQPMQVLGQANSLEFQEPYFLFLAPKRFPASEIGYVPQGTRVATRFADDPQWLLVLTDGLASPQKLMKLVPASSDADAIAQVDAGKADVALVHGTHKQKLGRRMARDTNDLKALLRTHDMPPRVIVSLGKRANPKLTKALVAALPDVCRAPGFEACTNVGFLALTPGTNPLYQHLVYKYLNYKP